LVSSLLGLGFWFGVGVLDGFKVGKVRGSNLAHLQAERDVPDASI